jgi:polyhydroxyalkanoate synthesis regulator phasin
MGDPSQTDIFEEATYVKPKYLQLHDTQNDFNVLPTMYLREKEDMSAEELRKVVDDILQELKDYEGELAKKDKGYTGRTIQVEKSGTGELIRELQKTIAEQERETHKLHNRIQELQKRMESLKKSK